MCVWFWGMGLGRCLQKAWGWGVFLILLWHCHVLCFACIQWCALQKPTSLVALSSCLACCPVNSWCLSCISPSSVTQTAQTPSSPRPAWCSKWDSAASLPAPSFPSMGGETSTRLEQYVACQAGPSAWALENEICIMERNESVEACKNYYSDVFDGNVGRFQTFHALLTFCLFVGYVVFYYLLLDGEELEWGEGGARGCALSQGCYFVSTGGKSTSSRLSSLWWGQGWFPGGGGRVQQQGLIYQSCVQDDFTEVIRPRSWHVAAWLALDAAFIDMHVSAGKRQHKEMEEPSPFSWRHALQQTEKCYNERVSELFPLSDGAVLTSPGHVGDVGVCPCDLWPLPCSSLQSGWHRWEPIDMLSLTSVSFLSLIGTVYSHQLKFVRKCNTVLKAHFTLGTCPMRCYFTLQSKRTGVKETRQWCQVVTLFWSAFQV